MLIGDEKFLMLSLHVTPKLFAMATALSKAAFPNQSCGAHNSAHRIEILSVLQGQRPFPPHGRIQRRTCMVQDEDETSRGGAWEAYLIQGDARASNEEHRSRRSVRPLNTAPPAPDRATTYIHATRRPPLEIDTMLSVVLTGLLAAHAPRGAWRDSR